MAQQAQDGIQSNAIHEVVDTKKKGRVIFASQLRAIAFLSVVAVHWLGIYSLNPTFISSVTGAPDVSTGNSAYYISILPPLPYFNYGPFGVSIFFIISGFVLTYSMRNKSPLGYLFARIIRIYPTYIVLMNPLMILVKIIKLRWIHILSYDQMVSRKINNQTTRCANSIF
ncbi:acyltransferase family protein, partial [Escherichia coli]|uniref:acyltransferase family protein n=1 Tax=Escherichia coli TaxID=562 RepID=UPI0039C17FD8